MIEICSSYEILLNKKSQKKPAILGKISNFSENVNVLRHNFFCRAAILIWKVALEIKIWTTGTEDIGQTKICPFNFLSYKIHKYCTVPLKKKIYLKICFSSH